MRGHVCWLLAAGWLLVSFRAEAQGVAGSFEQLQVLVKTGDTVIEVETDKASMPIPAEADGTVSEVRVKSGDKIKVGAVIAVLGDGKPQAGARPEPTVEKEASGAKPQATITVLPHT